MHSSEELLVDWIEIELLLVNQVVNHSMFFNKRSFSLDLAECPLIGVFILVLQFDNHLLLRFPGWQLVNMAMKLLRLIEEAPPGFHIH